MDTKHKDVRLSIRIDPKLKTAGQNVANDMGLDLTTAVKMFITAMVKEHRLPFEPTSLPADTLQALQESEHHKDFKTYDTAKEMWDDLDV